MLAKRSPGSRRGWSLRQAVRAREGLAGRGGCERGVDYFLAFLARLALGLVASEDRAGRRFGFSDSGGGAWRAATAALYLRTNRDFRRAAALAWTTPFFAARSSLLRAARTARRAASGSPAAMVASAFLTIVLVALRTMRLRRRRCRDWRCALAADRVANSPP